MSTSYKPDGCQDVIPYLIMPDIKALSVFIEKTFDNAKEVAMMPDNNGNIMHGEMTIGDCRIMMGQSGEQFPPMPSMLYIYVKDADATYKRAIEAGATSVREVETQFYGDRSGGVVDKWGNQWWFGTKVEDVSDEEMDKRHQEYVDNQQQ